MLTETNITGVTSNVVTLSILYLNSPSFLQREAVDGVDLQPVAAVAAVLESGEDFKEAGEVALAADFRLVEGLVEGLEEVVVFVEAEAAVAVEVFEDPNLVEALKLFILSSVTCLIEHYYILRR